MADEQFTHTFEIDLGADGSQFVHGQVEFNTDGRVSFKIEETSIPLSKAAIDHFNKCMDLLQTKFREFGGIKKIEILQKP
jgi:hypothetical protein